MPRIAQARLGAVCRGTAGMDVGEIAAVIGSTAGAVRVALEVVQDGEGAILLYLEDRTQIGSAAVRRRTIEMSIGRLDERGGG